MVDVNLTSDKKEWKPEIHYCEFNKHDYYALIAVKKTRYFTSVYQKAYKLYLEFVGGDSVNEIKQEGLYDEITRDQALLKFLLAQDEDRETCKTIKELVKDFDSLEDEIVLIDGSLI